MESGIRRRGTHGVVGIALLCLLALNGCGVGAGSSGGRGTGVPRKAYQWEPVRVTEYRGRFDDVEGYGDVKFVTRQKGWVGRANYQAAGAPDYDSLWTDDGGKTWTKGALSVWKLDFVDSQIGWVVPDVWATKVGVTQDQGASWAWHSVPVGKAWNIAAISAQEAWVICRPGVTVSGGTPYPPDLLLHTRDGGETWEQIAYPMPSGPRADLVGLDFYDADHGWVVAHQLLQGTASQGYRVAHTISVLRTEDGGRSFDLVAAPAVPVGPGLSGGWPTKCLSATEVWIASGGCSLLHTTDGGRSWAAVTPLRERPPEETVWLNAFSFPTAQTGWVVGSEHYYDMRADDAGSQALALRTVDGGKTWKRVRTGAETVKNGEFSHVDFVDEHHGWVVGNAHIWGWNMSTKAATSFVLKYEAQPAAGPGP